MTTGSLYDLALAIQTDTTPPLSLDEIAKHASLAGYGKPKEMKRQFIRYQELGLIGAYTEKEKRQGGGGLWHPGQGALFSLYLRLRKEQKADTISMANIPIGMWWLECAFGNVVTIEQAQKAFRISLENYPELWSRRVQGLESNTADSPITRNIRETRSLFDRKDRFVLNKFFDLNFERAQPGVTQEAFMNAGFQFRNVANRYQNELKSGYFKLTEQRLLALKYRAVLSTPRMQPLWIWAREQWLDALDYYLSNLESIKTRISIPMMPETANEILGNGMIYLLQSLGFGISEMQKGRPLPEVSTLPDVLGEISDYFLELKHD